MNCCGLPARMRIEWYRHIRTDFVDVNFDNFRVEKI